MWQAARGGLVDFSALDLSEPVDRRRLRLLLDGLVAENERKTTQANFAYSLAIMVAKADSDAIADLHSIVVDQLGRYEDSLMPWASLARRRAEQRAVRTLKDAWESSFGKMDDPATQLEIQATVEAMREARIAKKADRNRMAEARTKLLAAERDRKLAKRRKR
jgi:hypothetical protein